MREIRIQNLTNEISSVSSDIAMALKKRNQLPSLVHWRKCLVLGANIVNRNLLRLNGITFWEEVAKNREKNILGFLTVTWPDLQRSI